MAGLGGQSLPEVPTPEEAQTQNQLQRAIMKQEEQCVAWLAAHTAAEEGIASSTHPGEAQLVAFSPHIPATERSAAQV